MRSLSDLRKVNQYLELKINKMEEFAKEMGFDSLNEFNALVANVDINNKEKMKVFIEWKENDGTKNGLLLLLKD